MPCRTREEDRKAELTALVGVPDGVRVQVYSKQDGLTYRPGTLTRIGRNYGDVTFDGEDRSWPLVGVYAPGHGVVTRHSPDLSRRLEKPRLLGAESSVQVVLVPVQHGCEGFGSPS